MTGVDAEGTAFGEVGRVPAGPGPARQTGALPDFVIIGAQKGGTTTLYRLLAAHPSVRPAVRNRKELHYFSKEYHRGLGWYRSRFPAPEDGKITGEASPYYLYHPHAPRRMAQAVPDVRLIAMLRNPVDRAYSHWQMVSNMGEETLSFEDALAAEDERVAGEEERMLADEGYVSHDHQFFSYLSRGIYAGQLKRWREYFPKEQLIVLKSEEFFSRPMAVLAETLRFLGLPAWEPAGWEVVLRGEYGRGMDPGTRRRLEAFFRPHNERLYEYLGRDFGW